MEEVGRWGGGRDGLIFRSFPGLADWLRSVKLDTAGSWEYFSRIFSSILFLPSDGLVDGIFTASFFCLVFFFCLWVRFW